MSKVEYCCECGEYVPVKVPEAISDISGTLLCAKCAEKAGMPTLMSQLQLRLKCEEGDSKESANGGD